MQCFPPGTIVKPMREISVCREADFFPYFPNAACSSDGNLQACEIVDGTVMIFLWREFTVPLRGLWRRQRSIPTQRQAIDWATRAPAGGVSGSADCRISRNFAGNYSSAPLMSRGCNFVINCRAF